MYSLSTTGFCRHLTVILCLCLTGLATAQNYTSQLQELENSKAIAIENADYKLAGELNEKIKNLRNQKERPSVSAIQDNAVASQISALEKKKAKAVEEANYKLAGELNAKIADIKASPSKYKAAGAQADKLQAQIRQLEAKKKKAVAAADYKLAAELKSKIADMKANPDKYTGNANLDSGTSAQIRELEKKKEAAIAKADYKLAGEINNKIQDLKNPALRPTASSGGQPSSAAPSVVRANTGTRISRSEENSMAGINYRRSSLYSIIRMTNGAEQTQYANVIQEAFINAPLPTKFNDHNLPLRTIPPDAQLTDELAKHMVAAWFNRDEYGRFDMELIKERGLYNASSYDINVAQGSLRGMKLLEDAGEELLGNTFVIVNEFKYTSKEKVAKKAKKGLAFARIAGGFIPGVGGTIVNTATSVGSLAATVAGKGYWVKNTCHLYQLVWNDEIANEFYSKYWVDADNYDPEKVKAFDNCNLFKLKYVGFESVGSDLQSSVFTSKSDSELIAKATTKAIDKGIAKLERKFEHFRTKTPLYSVNPATAKIGLKEGLEPGDRYEVLEQVQDPNGKITYVRKGVLSIDKSFIWDNTYSAEELIELGKQPGQTPQFTVFKGNSSQFAPGMLIRQIN